MESVLNTSSTVVWSVFKRKIRCCYTKLWILDSYQVKNIYIYLYISREREREYEIIRFLNDKIFVFLMYQAKTDNT